MTHMLRNNRGFEAAESTLLLAIKVIVAMGIIILMAYMLHEMFGVGLKFG